MEVTQIVEVWEDGQKRLEQVIYQDAIFSDAGYSIKALFSKDMLEVSYGCGDVYGEDMRAQMEMCQQRWRYDRKLGSPHARQDREG